MVVCVLTVGLVTSVPLCGAAPPAVSRKRTWPELTPLTPAGPVGPVTVEAAPWGPVAPVGPVEPVAPVGPVVATAPV